MSNEEFERLIESIIADNPGMTQEQISVSMGYNEGYISQMLSRGKVSNKFVNAVKLKFAKSKGGGSLALDQAASYIIRNNALLTVVLDTQAEILSKIIDRPLTSVLREKQAEVKGVEESIRRELSAK